MKDCPGSIAAYHRVIPQEYSCFALSTLLNESGQFPYKSLFRLTYCIYSFWVSPKIIDIWPCSVKFGLFPDFLTGQAVSL